MGDGAASPFVSRAGLKLDHALREFDVDVTGLRCADFGCNVGGFTDCLLRRGAVTVYAVDTGYGTLAYALRTDPRVEVMERRNVLHAPPPSDPVDLVTIDVAWTPQRRAVPAAVAWLAPVGRIISLVKPHYELTAEDRRRRLVDGRLPPDEAASVFRAVLDTFPSLGVEPIAHTRSPITGAKSGRRGAGNVEYLVLARVRATDPS